MASRLEKSYQVLGLSKGSSFEEVHKARRHLAMKWHPDRFQNEQKKKEANRQIQNINAAYTHIKKIKSNNSGSQNSKTTNYRRASYRNRSNNKYSHKNKSSSSRRGQTSSNTNFRYKKSNESHHQSKQQKAKEDGKGQWQKEKNYTVNGKFSRSWIDELLTRSFNRKLKKRLARNKNKRIAKMNRHLEREQKEWFRRYQEFQNRERVGMYRSTINTLLFRKFGVNSESTTSLGSVQTQSEKYNIEVRHNLIKDQIFYCINKGLNLILKFTLGILFPLQFIYNIYENFYYGFFLGTVSGFTIAQLMVLLQLAVLFIPDNIYQRYLLWKYRNLESGRIRSTFKNRTLPSPYEYKFRMISAAKYSFLALVIWLYYF